MQTFEKIPHQDDTISRLQDRIKAVLSAIIRKPILDGILTEAANITPTGAQITHKLGRKPRGFVPVSGPADVVFSYKTADEKFLYLQTNTLTLNNQQFWVF